jgi:UDP-N-acetylmuramate--alanine ligase
MASNVTLPAEQVHFEPSWSAVPAALVERAKPGDIIMTLGAGEIGLLAPEILERLAEAHR